MNIICAYNVVLHFNILVQVVECSALLTVELQYIFPFIILECFVGEIYSIALFLGCREQALAEGDEWLVISDIFKYRGHYVGLLRDCGAVDAGRECRVAVRREEYHRDLKPTCSSLVTWLNAVIGMVGCYYKECIVVPLLSFGILKEFLQGVVGILHTLEERVVTSKERLTVFCRDLEGVVR